MISKTAIDSYSKPENFITRLKDLKLGYLYLLKDQHEVHIMLVTKVGIVGIQGDLVETSERYIERRMFHNYFNVEKGTISPVPETDNFFDQANHFAFYEISPKENHPEYFL
jgi:hypothetical protein